MNIVFFFLFIFFFFFFNLIAHLSTFNHVKMIFKYSQNYSNAF